MAAEGTGPADAAGRRAGALQGVLLLLPSTLSVMGVVVLAPGLPQIMAHFAKTPHVDVLAPLILTTPALFIALCSGPAGALADRVGRRPLLLWALGLYAVLGTAPLWLGGLWAILASRALVGVTEAVILTVSTALIGDYFHGRARETWLAAQTGVAALASVVLFALGGVLSQLGWRAPFAMYACSLLLLAALAAFTWEPWGEREADLAHGAAEPFPWGRMGLICAVTLGGSVIFFLTQVELALGFVMRGVTDPGSIGGLTALAAVAVPVGTGVFRLASRGPTAVLLGTAFGLMGAGLLGMGLTRGVAALTAFTMVNQLGCGMVLSTLITWAMRGLPYHLRGKGAGVWTATFEFGQFLTPLVFAAVRAATGGLFPAFTAFGVACVVGAVAAGAVALRGTAPAGAALRR